tara:strand:+ start:2408 stop:2683 length:276 start_codon:yes stop_codon:yes gene_type:complete
MLEKARGSPDTYMFRLLDMPEIELRCKFISPSEEADRPLTLRFIWLLIPVGEYTVCRNIPEVPTVPHKLSIPLLPKKCRFMDSLGLSSPLV